MTELNYLDITKASDGHIKVPSIGLTSPAITESIAKTAVASFADGAGGFPFRVLKGYINPVQTGSGDPSPSNVRPITGWTGMNVTRTGKNLFDFKTAYDAISGVTTGTNSWTASGNSFRTIQFPIPKALLGTELTFSAYLSTEGTNVRVAAAVNGTTKNGTTVAGSTEGLSTLTFTPTTENDYISINYSSDGTTTVREPICCIGSSAADFEPYTGTTYPISWEDEAGTVYGGTLDVTNGKLIATVEYKAMTGNMFTGWAGSTVKRAYTGTGYDDVSILMCDSLTVDNDYDTVNHIGKQSGGARIFVSPSWAQSCEDLTQFKSALANNPINAIVTLATPIEYDIDPESISTILGQNNIWADTGDVEVAYCADTKMYIDSKL